jgi:hypothetical protein
MQPGKLRIIHDEPEEFARRHGTMHFLVLAALHFQQRLVQPQERFTESYKLPPCRSISPIALIRVWIFVFGHR